jgi:hypothetical protein
MKALPLPLQKKERMSVAKSETEERRRRHKEGHGERGVGGRRWRLFLQCSFVGLLAAAVFVEQAYAQNGLQFVIDVVV